MKKRYIHPVIGLLVISTQDILALSDVRKMIDYDNSDGTVIYDDDDNTIKKSDDIW